MVNASKTRNKSTKPARNIINAENYSLAEQQGIIKLYEALVPGDDKRQIDIKMIMTEAFPKFEETIGEKDFEKVQKYFGIKEGKTNSIKEFEIRSLIAKLRTVENAQYYIVGYKQLVKNMAAKLLNAPQDMSELEKVKIIRMFFIVLANNEIYLEDYAYKSIGGKQKIVFDEKKALSNNKLIFGPEEMMELWSMKVMFSEGYYYDMMIIDFKRMYREYQATNNKYKNEIAELLEFSELQYDGEKFTSVNKCMTGATFGKIRQLKQRIYKVHGMYPMEFFCTKKIILNDIDLTYLYIIYKTLISNNEWKTEERIKVQTYRTMSGSRFIDQKQKYYEVFENFIIADEDEAERWIALFEYVARYELKLSTKYDGEEGKLSEPETYNVGAFVGALNYAMDIGYINMYTRVIWDFMIAKNLLALEGGEEIFLKFKRHEVKFRDIRNLLGITEEFEENVLHIGLLKESELTEEVENEEVLEEPTKIDSENDNLVEVVIKFALENDWIESESDIDTALIENVFIPGNEELIKMFSAGEIKGKEFEKKIGFETEYAESYFNLSKIDIKLIEAKLQEIKKSTDKRKVRNSKLLVALYCYIIKSGIACGPKNKVPKRNKGLKPEILEKLIA